ncbi:hypothetical protein [Shewanella baltica]|uniref:hypothetical protein n=1 Tax=Shewanella baltica TaxID=62322 RepID=UPI0024BB88A1|nr:hypothetical protein [Shewanella baltica]
MQHIVKFTVKSKSELANLDKDVAKKLWDSFLNPIRNGLTPPEELQGKYKPSWASKFVNSPMKQAFIEHAERYNLHHYHFGYKLYFEGNDPDYSGDVSDGIIHTRIEVKATETIHVILETCLKHPSPFKYPFERANDLSTD